mgnify:CR=1 FL=1
MRIWNWETDTSLNISLIIKKMQCQILCFIFKMLTRKISGHILTIGCEYRHPKGGVAQVMYNYEKYVFPVFNCIVNSGGTNNVAKLLKAISGYLLMAIHLTTDSHLRIVHILQQLQTICIFRKVGKSIREESSITYSWRWLQKILRYKPEMDCFRVESVWHDCYLVRIMEKLLSDHY